MKKYQLTLTDKQGHIIDIKYKYKSKAKIFLLTFLIDIIIYILFGWWWYVVSFIITTIFMIKKYSEIDDVRNEVNYFLNHNYYPIDDNSAKMLINHFGYSEQIITHMRLQSRKRIYY